MRLVKLLNAAALSGLALAAAACSEAEVSSPGNNAFAPGTGAGAGGGGGGGGAGGGACPPGVPQVASVNGFTTCRLSGQLLSTLTLTPGVIYQVFGRYEVGADVGGAGTNPNGVAATLNIEPGVRIFGSGGLDFIVINRGSRLNVSGTATSPVVMTSRQDIEGSDTPTSRGQWGGLVILGRAPINSCPLPVGGSADCEAQIEGVGSGGFFGGASADDNSGTIRFLQVKYSGFELQPNNELNGITFGGVGRATTLENVAVHNSSDDGVEFFGGSANIRNLVLTGNSDDSLDWDAGWNGNIQFGIVLQAADEGDHLIEADNNNGNNDKLPRSSPAISNFTFVGARPNGILLRRGTDARIVNSVVVNSTAFCLRVDNAATKNVLNLSPKINSILFDCPVFSVNGSSGGFTAAEALAYVNSGANNSTAVADTLTGTFINGPTENGRPTFNPVPLAPSFFVNAGYIGAVQNSTDNWWRGGWACGLPGEPLC